MATLTKHAEVLDQLHKMVLKKAEAQTNISGKPGVETKPESAGPEYDKTDKNGVGADKNPQGYSQKPSKDPAEPIEGATGGGGKTASDLGADLLKELEKASAAEDEKLAKEAADKEAKQKAEKEAAEKAAEEAQKGIVGKPGKNVEFESTPDANIDKNSVGADKNKPQEHSQKPAKGDDVPLKGAKSASEQEELAAKVASFELGRQLGVALVKMAHAPVDELEIVKQAGRRDFDLMIAQAAQGFTTQDQEKQAEQAGAEYFDTLMKQAAVEGIVEENEALKAKLAEYEGALAYYNATNQELLSKQAAEKAEQLEIQKQASMVEQITKSVIAALKSEPATK